MKRLLFIAIPGLLVFPLSVFAQQSKSAKKYVKHGIERFSKGDIAGAILEYDRALSVDPKLAEAYLNRGRAKRDRLSLRRAGHFRRRGRVLLGTSAGILMRLHLRLAAVATWR